MRKLSILFTVLCLVLMSCDQRPPSADAVVQAQQEDMVANGRQIVGMPGIHNWFELKTIKQLYEKRDDNKTIKYAYLWSEVTGKATFISKCIGFGIPYATQFSAPQKLQQVQYGGATHREILPQSEPNGLFMPAEARGTWLILINPVTGVGEPGYFEPDVITTPWPLPPSIVQNP